MTFVQIMELVISYASIWVPAIASVLATVCAVVGAVSKASAQVQKLKNTADFKETRAQLAAVREQERKLTEAVMLLIDEQAKIKGYADAKLGDTHDQKTKN